jgi:ABC-type phosphate transport system substrate-binding protein
MKRVLLMLTGITILSATVPANTHAQNLVVVVNADNPVTTLSKSELSNIFLKKVKTWPNRKPVVPVDHPRNAKLYEVFAKTMHNRSASSINTYWQTQIFSGNDVPPANKATDADVLAFVRTNPNAVGYIDAETPLGAGVKAVAVR